MDTTYAERHVRAMELARRCFLAGARISTVEYLTGLDRSVLRKYFFDRKHPPKPGKRPDSVEAFLKNATLLTMVEASVFYCAYRRHLELWPCRAESVLCGYLQHKEDVIGSALTLDRAFYVVCWTDGLWATREKALRFATCTVCHSRYIAALAGHEHHERDCPFCRLWSRYAADPRIKGRFPERRREEVQSALSCLVAGLRRAHEDRSTG